MRDSWKRMQVPIFGIMGIILIFLVIVVTLGATTEMFVGRGYADLVPLKVISGEKCDLNAYDPVCCDDGVTYSNLCLCREAGQTPEYQGICR